MNECLIEYPYKHFISSSFFDEVDFGVLHNNLNLLEWELYRKQSYEYWISSLDYNCEYYKVTKQILNKKGEKTIFGISPVYLRTFFRTRAEYFSDQTVALVLWHFFSFWPKDFHRSKV